MKKENRELAKQQKARQKALEKRRKKLKTAGLIAIPVLVILLVVGLAFWNSGKDTNSSGSTDNASSVTDVPTTDTSSTLNTDNSLVVEDGDTVNIDYVGTVDDVEFDGGNTQGSGTDLIIGSGNYIDDFEEQLVGHNVGETVQVEVTFPEDYGNDKLNGKDAVFKTVINGIYGR